MNPETLNKVLSTAENNPKGTMALKWYLLICNELDIEARPAEDGVVFRVDGRQSRTNLITEKNAEKFNTQVKPGTQSILLYEFMLSLVSLLTDKNVQKKDFDKLGEKAEYSVQESIKILREKFSTVTA